jgi:hypothetical protein
LRQRATYGEVYGTYEMTMFSHLSNCYCEETHATEAQAAKVIERARSLGKSRAKVVVHKPGQVCILGSQVSSAA